MPGQRRTQGIPSAVGPKQGCQDLPFKHSSGGFMGVAAVGSRQRQAPHRRLRLALMKHPCSARCPIGAFKPVVLSGSRLGHETVAPAYVFRRCPSPHGPLPDPCVSSTCSRPSPALSGQQSLVAS